MSRLSLGLLSGLLYGALRVASMSDEAGEAPGLKRSAAVVQGNVGTHDDAGVLTRALDDAELLVREHAAWALDRLMQRAGT